MANSIIKTFIFTVLVPGTVTVLIPFRWLEPGAKLHRAFGLIGLLPIALGAGIYFWTAWDFATAGLGTPAPIDPPKFLVARGLYRFVRNPMYLGVLLILLGESIALASRSILIYALGAAVFYHLLVVLYEEPALRRKFGAPYKDYCRTVPRWLPRPPPVGGN